MKQLVDRLRAEIAFLREQLKNNNASESNDRSTGKGGANRSGEKEIELQNQLLDLQENYSALSQRHAKLISDIARARDTEEPAQVEYADTAVERLARSNSFAEAVEQLVLGKFDGVALVLNCTDCYRIRGDDPVLGGQPV